MADSRSLRRDISTVNENQSTTNSANRAPNLVDDLTQASSRVREAIANSMSRIANREYAPDDDKKENGIPLASSQRREQHSVSRENTALNHQIITRYGDTEVYSSTTSALDPEDLLDHTDLEAANNDRYPNLASLIELLDTGTSASIESELNARVGGSTQSRYERLSKPERKTLLDHFSSKHRAEYYTVLAHAYLGYGGEFFYLYWDLLARVELVSKFFPSTPEAANWAVNGILTIPITEANVTYNPVTEAEGWMLNKMLTPSDSLFRNILDHKTLAACFTAFAFGGGYVEVVSIDENLTEIFGEYGKIAPITLLIYAAIAYYTAYNFKDTIGGFNKWLKSPSLIKKVLNPFNGEPLRERCAGGFVLIQEALTLVHRMVQMGYGGFEAGKQQSGAIAAYVLGSMVGVGSIPVALGTRVMATETLFYNQSINADVYAAAQEQYNARYSALAIFEELKLFFTPTLLALVPLAIVGYELGHNIADDANADAVASEVIATGFAIMLTLATHFGLGLRYAAQRQTVTAMALASLPQHIGDVIPNLSANIIATIANLTDQLSRGLNFIKALNSIFPDTFNFDTKKGFDNIITALFISLFIALSAFRYQKGKGARALVALFPDTFGIEITEAPRANPANQATPEVVVADAEEKREEYENIDAENDVPVRSSITSIFSNCLNRTFFSTNNRKREAASHVPVIAPGQRSDDVATSIPGHRS